MARQTRARSDQPAAPITAHKGFVALIAGWLAAFMGLTVVVLPASYIARAAALADLATLGSLARPAIAILAAAIGGAAGYGLGKAIQAAGRKLSNLPAGSEHSTRRPIVPSEELGSASLDAPLDPVDNDDWSSDDSDQAVWGDSEPSETDIEPLNVWDLPDIDSIETEPEEFNFDSAWVNPIQADATETREGRPGGPLELDRFELSPKETSARAHLTSPAEAKSPHREPFRRGLDRDALGAALRSGRPVDALRHTPKRDLSLIQMVERFAAALHDHQERHPRSEADGRDAALAEGLRALAILAGERPAVDRPNSAEAAGERSRHRQQDLRDALEKLRRLSDVA